MGDGNDESPLAFASQHTTNLEGPSPKSGREFDLVKELNLFEKEYKNTYF